MAVRRRLVRQVFFNNERVVPGYFQLVPPDFPAPPDFEHCLRDRLERMLSQEGSDVRPFLPEDKKLPDLLNVIIPTTSVRFSQQLDLVLKQLGELTARLAALEKHR